MNLTGTMAKAQLKYINSAGMEQDLDVEFLNPETITDGYVARGLGLGDKKCENTRNVKHFRKLEREPLSVDLLLDRSEITSITNLSSLNNPATKLADFFSPNAQDEVNKIKDSLMLPTEKDQKYKKPAICKFIWGSFTYEGYVTRLSVKYTYFSPSGAPLRAVISLTLEDLESEKDQEQTDSMGGSRKTWTVKSGDRLDLISMQMYNDPSYWRLIASENNIDRTLRFPGEEDLGRVLIVPDLQEAKQTGRV